MTRAERAAEAARLRAEGLIYREIADRLGVSRSYATDLVLDPVGAKAKARKDSYRGICVDCGASTSGSEGRRAEPHCVQCSARRNGAERKIWTREAVIAAIHDWAAEHGEPPASPDWNPTAARDTLHDDVRADYWSAAGGRWPHASTVIYAFGSWSAAIEAAGFESRPAHGGGGNERRRRSLRQAA